MPGFELLGKEEKKEILKLFKFQGSPKKSIFSNAKNVKKFENEFSKYIGSKYAVMVSSGTAAIKTALVAAGIKHGDEVITQCFNFIAVVEAIIDVGAKPVITEINETTRLMKRLKASPQIFKSHGIKINQDGKKRSAFDLLGYKDVKWEKPPDFEKLYKERQN